MHTLVYRDNNGKISGKPITLGIGAKVKTGCRLPMESFRKGVAAPVETIRGNVTGFLFDAEAEALTVQFCVPTDWDAASDIGLVLYCVLDADETENDLIDWETTVVSVADHEDVDVAPTQTPGAAHNIGAFVSAGMLHKVTIILDYDHATCPIAPEDNVSITISRTANIGQVGYVAGVLVLDICVEYTADKLGEVL